jgi:hypothetical protein
LGGGVTASHCEKSCAIVFDCIQFEGHSSGTPS